MPSCLSVWKRLLVICASAAVATAAYSQSAFAPKGGEYSIAGELPGEQIFSDVAFDGTHGYLVWQDNNTDGDGLGIAARRLDQNQSGVLSVIKVNQNVRFDQERPKVAMLKDGGAVVVWQGGRSGYQKIYARFLTAAGTFSTGDIQVNTYTNSQQVAPALAILNDGNVVITWASYGQDGDKFGIYGQILSKSGQKVGSEFSVNQTQSNNQRDAAVTALEGGGFSVAWVTEVRTGFQRNIAENGSNMDGTAGLVSSYKVQVFGRVFGSDGSAKGNEFALDSGSYICAEPVIAGVQGGGFVAAWSARVGRVINDGVVSTNGWDVIARTFGANGVAAGSEFVVNEERYRDQINPTLAVAGNTALLSWVSIQQDGSREGIYGRYIGNTGGLDHEFRVNTTTVSSQISPVVSSDGSANLLVVWSSFVGGINSMDLFAQRFSASQAVPIPEAPFVTPLSQSKLNVSWPALGGYNLAGYLVFVDGGSAVESAKNTYTITGLNAGTVHSVKIAYKLQDGTISPTSTAGSGQTWGEDANFDGLPDDWQARFFGADSSKWPAGNVDSDGDRASNLSEFLAGTDPSKADSVLRARIVNNRQSSRMAWNTQPGGVYQVQSSLDFATWTNVGEARFAPGSEDFTTVSHSKRMEVYRIIRLR